MAIDKKLNWRMLEKLYTLYAKSKPFDITNEMKENGYIMNVMYKDKKLLITHQHGKKKKFYKTKKYDDFFKNEFEKEYCYLSQMLKTYNIPRENSQLLVEDIKNLFRIENNKDRAKGMDIRSVSSEFFDDKDSKYIENSKTLESAILRILGLSQWLENRPKENQAIEVVHAIGKTPTIIVLCENRYLIKNPWHAMENNIEVWYAGGRNIKKLENTPDPTLPIYYNCDWDRDGLEIYEQIKQKIPTIQLLTHFGRPKSIYTDNHSSEWKEKNDFSNLRKHHYTTTQIEIIENLIKQKEWIEEESMPILTILDKNEIKY